MLFVIMDSNLRLCVYLLFLLFTDLVIKLLVALV